MRLTLFPLAVTALLATSVMADELKPVRSITVTGVAERKVVPDEAHMVVNLNAQEKQLAAAKSAQDKKIDKLLEIVKAAGIEGRKVRTYSSSIQPVYEGKSVPVPRDAACEKEYAEKLKKLAITPGMSLPPCPGGTEHRSVLVGYRAQTTIDVTVSDTKKLADLMQTVVQAKFEEGAAQEWGNLISTSYTLSDPDKIRDEMRSEAIKNARVKAGQMAAAAGASLGMVYQVTEGNVPMFNPQPMPMMAMAREANAGVASALPAGEQSVSASVTVTYELK